MLIVRMLSLNFDRMFFPVKRFFFILDEYPFKEDLDLITMQKEENKIKENRVFIAMVRESFKPLLTRFVPRLAERSTYFLLSCAALQLVMFKCHPIPSKLWRTNELLT